MAFAATSTEYTFLSVHTFLLPTALHSTAVFPALDAAPTLVHTPPTVTGAAETAVMLLRISATDKLAPKSDFNTRPEGRPSLICIGQLSL